MLSFFTVSFPLIIDININPCPTNHNNNIIINSPLSLGECGTVYRNVLLNTTSELYLLVGLAGRSAGTLFRPRID